MMKGTVTDQARNLFLCLSSQLGTVSTPWGYTGAHGQRQEKLHCSEAEGGAGHLLVHEHSGARVAFHGHPSLSQGMELCVARLKVLPRGRLLLQGEQHG